VNIAEWRDREHDGIKLIPRAGETLYRLRTAVGHDTSTTQRGAIYN
jgi:hypothetical protein